MGKGCLNVFLGLILVLVVVAGGALVTPWGQCELTYWTGFHANPTLRSAADLATFYPNRRAQEAEEFVYGQCTTAAAAREYQRLFPTGRYSEKVKHLVEEEPVAAPPPALPSQLLTVLKAGGNREISLTCHVYGKDARSRAGDLSLFEQQARKAVEDWLTSKGYTSRVAAAGESADLTLEIGVTFSGSFGSAPFLNLPSTTTDKGVPGYDTSGTIQLQGGSWKATFVTVCPDNVKYSYQTSLPQGPFSNAPGLAPPPSADTVVKINAEQVQKKITSCLNAVEVSEDSSKRLQAALDRLKQLESSGTSALLMQQAREELEATQAPPADIARALTLEAQLRAEQSQWLGAIDLTQRALALSPSPALRAQLASYRTKVWTELKSSDLNGIDPVKFKFPGSEKVKGTESNYFGVIWADRGEQLYPVTDLEVTSRAQNTLEILYNDGEVRFSFNDPNDQRVKTGTFDGGQGDGLSISRDHTSESEEKWRVRILELEVDPGIWEHGNERYQYKVNRLALDFIYKERGPQCTYGKIRYRSHFR